MSDPAAFKRLLVAALAMCLASVGSCKWLEKAAGSVTGDPVLTIDPEDRRCEKDEDCILAMVRCSCDCGQPVNRAHSQKYLDAQDEMCEDYSGKMCKMKCDQKLGCVQHVCTILSDE